MQVPQGAMLVDQGPPEADVAGQLRRFGIRELSLLVLTHPQRDHVGGAADVLSSSRVRIVLDPRLASSVPEERAALTEAKEQRVPVVTAQPGLEYAIGKLRVRVLWPDGPGVPSEDPNLRATVCLVSYGETDVLLGADAESPVLLPLRLPPVEVLKVSHHGSADAMLPALLEEMRPTCRGDLGRRRQHIRSSDTGDARPAERRTRPGRLPDRPRRRGHDRVRRATAQRRDRGLTLAATLLHVPISLCRRG